MSLSLGGEGGVRPKSEKETLSLDVLFFEGFPKYVLLIFRFSLMLTLPTKEFILFIYMAYIMYRSTHFQTFSKVGYLISNISYFKAAEKFKTWNEHNQLCYFPHQKKLKYFKSYMQENCKRECYWIK